MRGAVSDLVKDDEMQMVLSGNKDWGRKFRSLSLSTFASCFSYYPVPIAGWRRSKRSQVQSSLVYANDVVLPAQNKFRPRDPVCYCRQTLWHQQQNASKVEPPSATGRQQVVYF